MHIELIGCTSAGKTTLAQKIILIGKRQGIDIILGDDFVLKRFHLNWVKSEFIRRRLLEVYAGYTCMRHWKKYREFCRFVFGVVLQTPGSWFYKFTLVRIVLRKIGIHELIRRYNSETQLVLVDNEGIVQAAHNLFVHTNRRLNGNLTDFVKAAPLPDMIAYLKQPQSILLERTLRRGHPRIEARSKRKVELFVKQAVETFETLQTLPQIADRLVLIDGKSKAVTKPRSVNGSLVNQAYHLLSDSIKDDHSEGEPAPRAQSKFPVLGLIRRLAEELHTQGVSYCHWKSNINLMESLEGEGDLDFFVGRESVSAFLEVIAQLGFKAAKIRYGPETPGVTHYYGLDASTGKLVHIHLFTNIITGESFVKSHSFPFERMLLENCDRMDQLAVLSKPAELVVFVLRTFIKYGSLSDIVRLFGKFGDLNKELLWLLNNEDIGRSLSLLNEYCPAVSESLFLNCVEAINENHSFISKVFLALRVRKRLRNFAQYTFTTRTFAYARVLLAKLKCILKGNLKNKTLSSGGAVIAFVGADATGKSTLVAETERWLGKVFAVRKVHVGKPPTSLLTALVNMALPLVRRLLPQLRRSQIQTQFHDKKSSQDAIKGPSLPLYGLRALTLAWDRYQLLRKVGRAKARGELIICDRYPSELTGAMDSPRLEEQLGKSGLRIAFTNWLARKEGELYKRMPSPDIAIKLSVSLAVAKKRNKERIKGDKDTDEFIESRHRSAREWHKAGTKYAFEISTDQSLSDTILNTKKAIWESL
ncbi:MAG: hypothetical protein AMJ53_07290 [Gammaproteobacteria bacterium SG8_11]|nr:MAG: hypothetical protein AMJ53_07290 [Gammaproteobacteria bacterium SG8_11]